MPEPVSNSSRFDPHQQWCSADLEPPPPTEPEPGAPGVPSDSEEPPAAGPVFSLGFALSAESAVASLASPRSDLPGGVAVVAGIYFDVQRLEVGSYQRVEERWSGGAFAGGGVELGYTHSRSSFDGESVSVFAEGGALGKYGYAVSATGASVGVGFGEGAAAGVAVGKTTTDPIIEVGRAIESSPVLLRRGP